MVQFDFKKPYTVEQASEILRKAKMTCLHPLHKYEQTRQPIDLEAAEKPNAWSIVATCLDCDAQAQAVFDSPICFHCSNSVKARQLHLMRLVTTKNDPKSRYGKIFVYTCNCCEKNTEISFHSSYS